MQPNKQGKPAFSKVLVTGADGFIGSHLTEALVRAGYNVRAFVLYNSFNNSGWLDHCGQDVKGRFEVFSGDIRDPHGVKEAMKGCDAALHLAALIGILFMRSATLHGNCKVMNANERNENRP